MRVMQWNTLADSLCSNASFPHVPDGERVLSWSHRAPLLSRELSRFGANVVCLEEVDETHFSELHAALGPGFAGSFAKKHNEGRDGVALLFDTASLQEEHSTCVRLGESEAQVALMKVLRHNESGKRALVACTHLKAKEGFEAVRLAQVEALLKHVAEFQRKCGCEDAAVVIAGDFNDVRTSPACRAMETAGFLSVYGAYHPRQPFFTTFKKRDVEVCRAIDYIFFDPKRLSVRAIWDLPIREQLPNRLPSDFFPSDHLNLISELVLL